MLVHAKAPFIRGCLLLISFLALFGIMLMPLMKDELGNHMTGLQYADNVFNELSKGSSYFIPGVRNSVKTVEGKSVQLTVKLKKADLAALAGMVLEKSGATDVRVEDGKVSFSTDELGTFKVVSGEQDDAPAGGGGGGGGGCFIQTAGF